jgi:hypothetical protein
VGHECLSAAFSALDPVVGEIEHGGVACPFVWTGLNRLAVSPQIDFYTGAAHNGYAQDAMFARR